MKKIVNIFLTMALSLACVLPSVAQPVNRVANTIIVDALNQLPAQNQDLYNRLMSDISSTGETGVKLLLEMLQKSDASLEKVRYALNGYTAFAAASEDSKAKELLIAEFSKVVENIDKSLSGDAIADAEKFPALVSNKEFLNRQLKVLGVITPVITEKAVIDVKTAKKAYKSAKKSEPAFRSAALSSYIEAAGPEKVSKEIFKAILGDNTDYRMAALKQADKLGDDFVAQVYAKVNPILSKLAPQTQADLFYWMKKHPQIDNSASIIPFINSADINVVSEAAWALTAINNPESLPVIASLLQGNTNAEKIAIAQACLKCFKGNIADELVSVWNKGISDEAKVAVINLLAARKSSENKGIVKESLKSGGAVQKAAYLALKDVFDASDREELFSMMGSTDKEFVADVQNAVLQSVANLNNEQRFELLSAKKDAAPAEKQDLYWPLIFKSANYLQLLNICNDLAASNAAADIRDAAFDSYLSVIDPELPDAQKLLMLRNAMEFARTDADKNRVLDLVSNTNTFLSIIFAGQFIEEPALQQSAAQVVRKVALGNISYNGPEVVALLKRAAQVINNKDAQYEITGINQHLEKLQAEDEGFVSMFNGKDLTGWHGMLTKPYDNPYKRAKLTPKQIEKELVIANEVRDKDWIVEDGCIVYVGDWVDNLCTDKLYGNFEMYVDWFLYPEGPEADAGIYLRGTPQVQIWDTSRVDVGAQVGSGGLYNNQFNKSTPNVVADNGLGQWNSFYIKMVDERVTVTLNGVLVVDNVVLENYWNANQPIFPIEQIELQAHGSKVAYRNLYIHELPATQVTELTPAEKKEGFKMLFNGTSLNEWQGNKVDYFTSEGTIAVSPTGQGFGNLYSKEEYQDFIFRFEFKLTPGANNGIGIRCEMDKDAAYYGMEIQVLDHFDAIYQPGLLDYQYHGSVYGIIPTQDQNQLKPLGEWNEEEIYVKGDYIRVTLNGVVITEGNIREATKNGTYDHKSHPGLFNKSGYIAFLGHGSELWFRNVRVKRL